MARSPSSSRPFAGAAGAAPGGVPSGAPCPHFGACGGCAFQDRAYEAQLVAKADAAARAFAAAGLHADFAPPEPARERWFYRNRMSYIVGPGPAIGLRAPGRWDEIIDLGTCLLLSEPAHAVVNATRAFIRERGLEPYDLRSERGLVRYLVIREGKNTGHRLAMIIARTADFPFDAFAALACSLGCTGVALAVQPAPSDVASGEVVRFAGAPLEERIGEATFEIGPSSFFQPNTRTAERLVELAAALLGAGARREGTLVDLYCGVGLFAIALRRRFARAVGVEVAPSAILDARRNAERNRAGNVTVLEGDVETVLPALSLEGPVRAIVDPPRSGMRPGALRALAASAVETVVYASCNPATMARDIAALGELFRLDSPVFLLDSAPWTPHVEAAARLVRHGVP